MEEGLKSGSAGELWKLAQDKLVSYNPRITLELVLDPKVGSIEQQPISELSLEEWARLPYWSPDEAMALLLGKTPPLSDWLHGSRFSLEDELFERRCRQIHGLMSKQFRCGAEELATPAAYIEWATSQDLAFPPELSELVAKSCGTLKNYKTSYEETMSRLSETENELVELREKLKKVEKELQQEKEKSQQKENLNPKLGTTLRKLIIGMAIVKYRYNTLTHQSRVIKPIKSDLDRLELSLDEGTISEHLRAAAVLLKGKESLVRDVLGLDEPATRKK